MVNWRDVGLSTLCHSCGFAYQQRDLKMFPDPDCLCSKDGIVWLCNFLVNFSSPYYRATAQSQFPMVIGRHGGLNNLCHSCGFACQQKVLKMFSGPGYYLHSENGSLNMTFLSKSDMNISLLNTHTHTHTKRTHICIYIYIYIYIYICIYKLVH